MLGRLLNGAKMEAAMIAKLHNKTTANDDILDALQEMTIRIGDSLRHLETQLDDLADLRDDTHNHTNNHSAYINDIADVLEHVTALENRMPDITKEELHELHMLLQKLVDWAFCAAKTVNVPLKLP
jgi:hypothetical protein